jgi:hypothetical protein
MDALNFLLETTENLNSGDTQMNEGLYLDMMNRLRDLHRAMSQPQHHNQPIIRPPPPPQPVAPEAYDELVGNLRRIFCLDPMVIRHHWLTADWTTPELKAEFIRFLHLLVAYQRNGYTEADANAIATHPALPFSLHKMMSNSMNNRTFRWNSDYQFRDKFLMIPAVRKVVIKHHLDDTRRERNLIKECLAILADRDKAYTPEVKQSLILTRIKSPFMGEWRPFRRVFKQRSLAEMAGLHELELEFDYATPHPKFKVWTDRIQLGRTSAVQPTALFGLIHAIHDGKLDRITPLIHTIFGDVGVSNEPHMVVSGITANTANEHREYRGGWEECFRIRYTQELNRGGKKK